MKAKQLRISAEVQDALAANKPVVALESTIIAHGMPYPENVETSRRVESIIRDEGAIPATIAILNGKPTVGLTNEQLETLGKTGSFVKVSRRDLPMIIAKKLNGATTVASTMFLAARAGIRIFVTGGIGGVHREVGETLDISADLLELANTDVAVVCAGAKAILDIARTLEQLETHGVPVIGYRTNQFPAFYTRESGFPVDHSVDSPEELARVLHTKWDLGLRGGVLVANPIPAEHELDKQKIDHAISTSLREAKIRRIKGKEITPFLLSRIVELTEGESLKANIELVCHNARIGARLAIAFSNVCDKR